MLRHPAPPPAELLAGHTPAAIAARLARQPAQSYLRDFVYARGVGVLRHRSDQILVRRPLVVALRFRNADARWRSRFAGLCDRRAAQVVRDVAQAARL